jgi:hypothetical protein
VWLPLPHILLLPFVQVYSWWANGIAGVIPSALAYMAACAGIYRLARHWLAPTPSALALAFFALNPNLLYLQTTAMTEPLFVCEMVWVAVWLVEWRASLDADAKQSRRLLCMIAVALIAAIFTRYDGWIMALVAWSCMGLALARRGKLRSLTFWIASVLIVAAPIAWFVYNAVGFGDWLYFARGPYSAKAIELRTMSHGAGPPHPGWHNPWVSLLFFVKVAEMDAAAAAWGNVLLLVSLLGTAWAWLTERNRAFTWALLLWFPVPFYAYSVSYGSVPIFLPPWWPHSWYNTRYGMELLPALALALGFAAHGALAALHRFKPRWSQIAVGALFAIVAVNGGRLIPFTKGPRLRQRLFDRDRRGRGGDSLYHDWANLTRRCARATPASAPTASSSLPGPGRSRAAFACTTPTAPSPRSAATARAAWPRGWRASAACRPGDEVEIATDAGLRICRVNALKTDGEFTVEVTAGMGVPTFAPRTSRWQRWACSRGRRGLHRQSALRHRGGQCGVHRGGIAWQQIGAEICVHPDFPHQTNVEFVRIVSPSTKSRFASSSAAWDRPPLPAPAVRASATAALALNGCRSPLTVVAPGGAQTVAWSGPGHRAVPDRSGGADCRGEAWISVTALLKPRAVPRRPGGRRLSRFHAAAGARRARP